MAGEDEYTLGHTSIWNCVGYFKFMLDSRNNTPIYLLLPLLADSVADPPQLGSQYKVDASHTQTYKRNSINEPFEKYKQEGKIKT